MKKGYWVSSGEYSDWTVHGVFTSKKKAEQFVELHKTLQENSEYKYRDVNEWSIDEIEIDPGIHHLPAVRKGIRMWSVSMKKDGTFVHASKTEDAMDRALISVLEYGFDGKGNIQDPKGIMNLRCWAKNEKHAIKIANEYRTQLIALNLWNVGCNLWKDKNGFVEM